MLNKLLLQISSKPELIVLGIMVLVISMLIVPLPTFLIDFLIGLNIVISLLILMSSFYITRVLNFSTFPSILLITTMFRLSLSISTSRLILLQADAGEIITSFGEFVIGDNLVVGFVIFFIVTIVQFIVITKGSERVAEVAARFSLDAMPGKQMSIDADLKAGIIDNEGVKKRRSELENESQLFGSFDGAMKFIKGDAIAGIIIMFVNFIGGISVGVSQHGMDMSMALNTYTLLTIGDGLVAQIPALLISISAGFMVTRVGTNNKNLGENIINELFANDFTMAVTACLAVAIGFLPGFPTIVFMLLAIGLMGMYLKRRYKTYKDKKVSTGGSGKGKEGGLLDRMKGKKGESKTDKFDIDHVIPEAVPIIITISEKHREYLEQEQLDLRLKKEIFVEYGYRLPTVVVNFSENMTENTIVILINEIKAGSYPVLFNHLKVLSNYEELTMLGFNTQFIDEGNGVMSCWVSESDREKLKQLNILYRDDISELYRCCSALLSRHIREFFGVQETKNLLDDLEKMYPELLKECYRHATVQRISDVFQRLLDEKVSIRNMKLILEALVQWAPKEKDPILLVEHIRTALARYISNKFTQQGSIKIVMISAEIEDQIRAGIRQTSAGSFLNLEPHNVDNILDLFALALRDIRLSLRDIVVLTSVDTRRFLKKLIESRYPELEVLSFGEITEGTDVVVMKTV